MSVISKAAAAVSLSLSSLSLTQTDQNLWNHRGSVFRIRDKEPAKLSLQPRPLDENMTETKTRSLWNILIGV